MRHATGAQVALRASLACLLGLLEDACASAPERARALLGEVSAMIQAYARAAGICIRVLWGVCAVAYANGGRRHGAGALEGGEGDAPLLALAGHALDRLSCVLVRAHGDMHSRVRARCDARARAA